MPAKMKTGIVRALVKIGSFYPSFILVTFTGTKNIQLLTAAVCHANTLSRVKTSTLIEIK